VRIGIQLPGFTLPGGPERLATHLANAARWTEEAGASSLWVMDHLFQIPPNGAAELEMAGSPRRRAGCVSARW